MDFCYHFAIEAEGITTRSCKTNKGLSLLHSSLSIPRCQTCGDINVIKNQKCIKMFLKKTACKIQGKQHHESCLGFQFQNSPTAILFRLQHSLRHKSFKTSSRLHPLTSFVSIRASLQTNPYPVIPVPSQVTGVTQIIGTSTSNASFREGTAASSVVWRRKVFNKRCQPWSSCNRDDQYSNGLLLPDMLLK